MSEIFHTNIPIKTKNSFIPPQKKKKKKIHSMLVSVIPMKNLAYLQYFFN